MYSDWANLLKPAIEAYIRNIHQLLLMNNIIINQSAS